MVNSSIGKIFFGWIIVEFLHIQISGTVFQIRKTRAVEVELKIRISFSDIKLGNVVKIVQKTQLGSNEKEQFLFLLKVDDRVSLW